VHYKTAGGSSTGRLDVPQLLYVLMVPDDLGIHRVCSPSDGHSGLDIVAGQIAGSLLVWSPCKVTTEVSYLFEMIWRSSNTGGHHDELVTRPMGSVLHSLRPVHAREPTAPMAGHMQITDAEQRTWPPAAIWSSLLATLALRAAARDPGCRPLPSVQNRSRAPVGLDAQLRCAGCSLDQQQRLVPNAAPSGYSSSASR
jgi:hypothetical protein